MQLKRIQMQGFKSFADKLTLDFSSGITTFIGPNGSGKSNISDAVRWVLGEQNARLLRSSRMDDVIFAGSENRRPVGFAEVAITFDNSDGVLPVDFAEVTVTRRVFKSGESEFFINKTSCRLRDVRELFMDTGIGREGYSIIGQGRIDSILNAKAEERRSIFEEATGIIKYRSRKEEAEKKLSATEDNLLRIRDIIHEIETQLETLEKEAEKAKKYIVLRDELQSLEVGLYIDTIRVLNEKSKVLDVKYHELNKALKNAEAHKTELAQSKQQFGEKERQYAQMLETSKNQLHEQEIAIEAAKGERMLGSQKLNDIREMTAKSRLMSETAEQEIGEIYTRIGELEAEIAKHREFGRKTETEFEKLKNELVVNIERISKTEAIDEANRTRYASLTDSINLLKSREIAIETERLGIGERLAVLKNETETAEKEKTANDADIEQQEKLLAGLKTVMTADEENIRGSIDRRNSMIKLRDAKGETREKVLRDYQMKSSRLKTYKEMEDSMEGYQRGVKGLMLARKENRAFSDGIMGTVADMITVPQKYETAIEFALGNSVQFIVTRDEQDAKNAIEYLKKERLGRVTFLPVRTVRGRTFDEETSGRLFTEKGYIGEASDLVKENTALGEIVASLLGRTAVVSDMDCAINIANKYKQTFKIVTLEGDIINPGGAIAGGSRDNTGHSFLTRKREIASLASEVELLRAKQEETEKELDQMKTALAETENEISASTAKYRAGEIEYLNEQNRLNLLRGEADRNAARRAALDSEIRQQTEKREMLDAENADIASKTANYRAEADTLLKTIEGAGKQAKEALEAKEQLSAKIAELGAELDKNGIITANLEQNMSREKNEAALQEKTKKEAETACKGYAAQAERIENALKELSQREQSYLKCKGECEKQIETLSEERGALAEEFRELLDTIERNDAAILNMMNALNRAEADAVRQQAEIDTVKNRLWDQYNLTYENSQGKYTPPENINQAKKRAGVLREDIHAMGDVNVAAIDQYAANMERHRFMKSQEADVDEAGVKLRKIIAEITASMKVQFVEQFDLINKSFSEVFTQLFNGGSAYVELTDEANVLESGVEIIVQLPGKRLQNMTLMSGGERALTAIALLFGILKLKPSPFCLLDEIEAALDEANVTRFSNYLKTCSETTQFLVVTHRRGTMEMADVIYGVTMQEPGVSKIVSMKMKD